MVDREHPELSVARQCRLLGISRTSVYRRRKARHARDLELMDLIDRQYLSCPFYGSRRMTAWLRQLGYPVNRKRIQRLMREMGLKPIYPKPRTTRPHPEHKVYPYLLRGMTIDRVDQVWAADITYIPMARGFLYLVAIMDWASRKVLAWQLSNTMDANFCVAALKRALETGRRPEIFNTDQGAQFTSEAFTGLLSDHDIRISMDGRGRCQDNIFVERLWRSLKYEEVYLRAYDTVGDAETGIGAWMAFYNDERPHQALGNCTPAAIYAGGCDVRACGRPAPPAGWTGPGVLDGPGPVQPATTSPHANQPVVQAAPGLDNPPPKSATLAPGETPTHTEGPTA
jgi:putative transposase